MCWTGTMSWVDVASRQRARSEGKRVGGQEERGVMGDDVIVT